MSGNGACASTTYRGLVLRKYFRNYNRMGARRYLLPQLSHHCNFAETVRMNLRMAARAVIGRSPRPHPHRRPASAPTPAPTPSACCVSKLVSDSARDALACFAPVRFRHSNW
jgi:hypothetical protein